MSIEEAVKQGILRLRRSHWKSPKCYIKITVDQNGRIGPWIDLYDEDTQSIIGVPSPQCVLCKEIDLRHDAYEVYNGPISVNEANDDIKNLSQLNKEDK